MVTTIAVIVGYIYIFKLTGNIEYARGFSLAAMGTISAALIVGLSNCRTVIAKTMVLTTLGVTVLSIQLPWLAKFLSVTPLHFSVWMVVCLLGVSAAGLAKL